MLFDMVLLTEAANVVSYASVVSTLLSACLSLSVPRPTNLVLEAPNPIITKLTVNTQVSYPY